MKGVSIQLDDSFSDKGEEDGVEPIEAATLPEDDPSLGH